MRVRAKVHYPMKMLLPIVMINFFSEADYIAGPGSGSRRKSRSLCNMGGLENLPILFWWLFIFITV